uniref:C2H2-type domain-containing protein n=1 Tax=Timema monikensis TaxID=170555 RepID=A0A7R9HTD0_9NEOP|nr:unnamed protein product [Timema monikensis]
MYHEGLAHPLPTPALYCPSSTTTSPTLPFFNQHQPYTAPLQPTPALHCPSSTTNQNYLQATPGFTLYPFYYNPASKEELLHRHVTKNSADHGVWVVRSTATPARTSSQEYLSSSKEVSSEEKSVTETHIPEDEPRTGESLVNSTPWPLKTHVSFAGAVGVDHLVESPVTRTSRWEGWRGSRKESRQHGCHGGRSSVQQKKSGTNSLVLFVNCDNHSLNLVGVPTVKQDTMMVTLERSGKRHTCGCEVEVQNQAECKDRSSKCRPISGLKRRRAYGYRQLYCSHCPFHTTIKLLLEKHMRKHPRRKVYLCSICERTFPQSSGLSELTLNMDPLTLISDQRGSKDLTAFTDQALWK